MAAYDVRPDNLLEIIAMWNNKGGVGKTTLTFQTSVAAAYLLSQHHAERETHVLVIDACPQSNYTQQVLGGEGAGETQTANLANNNLVVGLVNQPRTIAGFLSANLEQPNPAYYNLADFVIQPSDHNPMLAVNEVNNLHIVAGDPYLDLLTQLLYARMNAPPIPGYETPHKRITLMLKRAVYQYIASKPQYNWIVMFDMNPAFVVYTEMAISAADSLVVPCNADLSSKVAVKGVLTMLYGTQMPAAYTAWLNQTYAHRAAQNGITVPRLKCIVNNRVKQYNRKSTQAFYQPSERLMTEVYEMYQHDPAVAALFYPPSEPVTSLSRFIAQYCVQVKDFNSFAVNSSRAGTPLILRNNTTQRLNTVSGARTSAGDRQLAKVRQDIAMLVYHMLYNHHNILPHMDNVDIENVQDE